MTTAEKNDTQNSSMRILLQMVYLLMVLVCNVDVDYSLSSISNTEHYRIRFNPSDFFQQERYPPSTSTSLMQKSMHFAFHKPNVEGVIVSRGLMHWNHFVINYYHAIFLHRYYSPIAAGYHYRTPMQ